MAPSMKTPGVASPEAGTVKPKSTTLGPADALIVVDVQRDYLPGGALAVPRGDEVVEPLNRVIDRFVRADLPIFYVRDWHPAGNSSSGSPGARLPSHCAANSRGAEFAPRLWIAESDPVVSVSVPHDGDAVSAFQGTPLAQQLRRTETRRIFVGGLATEYCVKQTVFDALAQGFEVFVLLDAVRGANLSPGEDKRALRVMRRRGARTILTDNIVDR